MDEFALIERFFRERRRDSSVVVPIGDDGAVMHPDEDRQLVAVVDTQVEGVHFPTSLAPADIGFRAVATNLSDIAAMGARPRWMTLALTLSNADADWLQAFSSGLFAAADEHDVSLVGGDTTSGPCLTVSVQLLGDVRPRQTLMRSGAAPGDRIYVSGHVGDAACGLRAFERGSGNERLKSRFARPAARIALGASLFGLASAAIDVSDGLLADLHKLLTASACGGEVDLGCVPLSTDLLAEVGREEARRLALGGGDDYELCFTAPAKHDAAVARLAAELKLPLTTFGNVTQQPGVRAVLDGKPVHVDTDGYRHFQ